MTPKRKPEPRLILDKALGGYRLWLNGTVILTFTAKQIPTIAAAPDLLAALHAIADAGESAANSYPGDGWRLAHEKFAAFARAAISKATGEL